MTARLCRAGLSLVLLGTALTASARAGQAPVPRQPPPPRPPAVARQGPAAHTGAAATQDRAAGRDANGEAGGGEKRQFVSRHFSTRSRKQGDEARRREPAGSRGACAALPQQ